VNISRCSSLARTGMRGTWYRAVDPRFLATALSTLHTATTPSRFSPASMAAPAFEILYLAENRLVALFEARAIRLAIDLRGSSPATQPSFGDSADHCESRCDFRSHRSGRGSAHWDECRRTDGRLAKLRHPDSASRPSCAAYRHASHPKLRSCAFRPGLVSGFRKLLCDAPGL